jgi:hypothetical protein
MNYSLFQRENDSGSNSELNKYPSWSGGPPTKINGRLNVYEEPDPLVKFKMQEKYTLKNKPSSYCDALNGIWENTTLSQAFFSEKNIQILQNAIRANVYKLSGNKYVILPPNIDNLKVVMRSTYLQYAEHKPSDITEQIDNLNKKVLEYAIPTIFEETKGYIKYLNDQATIVVPLELPLNHDRQFKQLELKEWV